MNSALIFKTKKHIYRDISGDIEAYYFRNIACYSFGESPG